MKKILIVLAGLLMFCFMSVSCATTKQAENPEKLIYDIQLIQTDLAFSSMKALYDPQPFEELKQDVRDGKANRIDCIYIIKEILCNFHIVHLRLTEQFSEDETVMYSPVNLYYMGDDFFVNFTTPKYQKYIGWKVKEIGGKPIDQAWRELARFVPYETEIGAKCFAAQTSYYYDFKYAGLLDKNNKISFELESNEGQTEKITCSFVNARKTKWIGIQPEKPNPYSPYFIKDFYELQLCPERKTIYVPYNSCQGIPGYPATDLISDLMKELQTGAYDTVVFDIRLNGGGEQFITQIFRHKLYDNREELLKYNLAIVIGGRTYSAACWFLNNFLDVFPEATVFGEETGEAVFNYTMVMPYELHNLGCEFVFPQIVDDLPVLKARAKDIYRGTMPDVEVKESFEDFMNGQDTIYNAIYEYYN